VELGEDTAWTLPENFLRVAPNVAGRAITFELMNDLVELRGLLHMDAGSAKIVP
jgi:hypothetical protein